MQNDNEKTQDAERKLTDDSEMLISKTVDHVKDIFQKEGSGHDWWHIYRVWKMAIRLCNEEGKVDRAVVELAALLHDIADWKFHGEDAGPKATREWLESLSTPEDIIVDVCEIISRVSFKGTEVGKKMETKEGMIVQDADRLDAIGAIGIARTFMYGGHVGNLLYEPDVPLKAIGDIRNLDRSSIHHFYDKILLLKELMNTESGKKHAEERHKFVEEYLNHFFDEWEGKD